MIQTPRSTRGMVTAPHALASQTGVGILRDGGNAVEAMIGMAASIAAVYPHMNSIGGDGFWLIKPAGGGVHGISACGATGAGVDAALYAGHRAIPARGPLAANTVAGTVSGWQRAHQFAQELGGAMSRQRLLEDAIWHADNGIAVTQGQSQLTEDKLPEFADVPGFHMAFLPKGAVPAAGEKFTQPRLAETLRRLAADGFDGFYKGALASSIANDLKRAGSPVTGDDLAAHQARDIEPLSIALDTIANDGSCRVFNHPPPTQGLASLLILGIFDRLQRPHADSVDYVHCLVEATKQAFVIRDSFITDPDRVTADPANFLNEGNLRACAASVDTETAMAWPQSGEPGDTIWMGAIDQWGNAVSFIQSIYWEFGSGVVLDETGIQWQNRGSSFSLDPQSLNAVAPGRLPFHTLNPALAQFSDGRVMVYGTMGGEGQPQTQAALFSRYAYYEQPLQQCISAPRWLLGRTWGDESTTLKLESRFADALFEQLKERGHAIERIGDFDAVTGHAGAVVRHADGICEGASDPRSDGAALGY